MSDKPIQYIGIEREQALFLYLGHKLLYDRKGRYKMPLFRRYIGYFIPQKDLDRALTWLLERGMLNGVDFRTGKINIGPVPIEQASLNAPWNTCDKMEPTLTGLHILDHTCSVFEAARDWDFGHWRTWLARWIFNRLAKAMREA